MAKSREKIQQIGFWDDQVSNPNHDAVCIWAYENTDLILKAVYPERFDIAWRKDEIDFHGISQDAKTVTFCREFLDANPRPNPKVTKKTIEYVLKSHTGYRESLERIVGYADLTIEVHFPSVSAKFKPSAQYSSERILEGFEMIWGKHKDAPGILVEVKSVLPTLGELLRQINLYRTAFYGKFVVIAPDDKYAEILVEQDVTFIQYKSLKAE
jgi:hypothetical protein